MKKLIIFILLLVVILTPAFTYTIEDYKEALGEMARVNEELTEYAKKLANENFVLREALTKNNETIKLLKKELEESKVESAELREQIKNVFTQLDSDKNNQVGIGMSYPLGGSIYYSIRPKNFPVGGFVFANFSGSLSVTAGATYSF